MSTSQVKLAAAALALTAGMFAGLGAGFAQDAPERTTDQYKCKDIMRESGTQRDVAIGFIHGYLLGRSGSNKFNIETLQKQTQAFIERCLDNPNETAMDAMAKVKG
jgi:hypothetical protein